MPCPAATVVPAFALSMLVPLPGMLLWLPVTLLPLAVAWLALRRASRVRWAAIDLVAAAARRVGLRGGVSWPLVLIRAAMLALAVLAATRASVSQGPWKVPPPSPSITPPVAPSVTLPGLRQPDDGQPGAQQVVLVVPGREPPAGTIDGGGGGGSIAEALPLRLAIEALGRTGGLAGGQPVAVDVVAEVDGLTRLLADEPEPGSTPARAAATQRLVILGDGVIPTAADATRLAAAVERGASLLVLVGQATLDSPEVARFSDWLAALAGVGVAGRIECAGCRIGVVPGLADGIDAAAPAGETTEPFVVLPGPVVDRCVELVLEPAAPPRSAPLPAVLARTTPDARPLLVESPVGGGRVCVSALPMTLPAARLGDEFWSDLAAWPVFVPVVDRLLARLLGIDESSTPATGVRGPRSGPGGDETRRPASDAVPLAGWLLAVALVLAVIDPLVSLAFSGGLSAGRTGRDEARARHARLLPARAAIIASLAAMLVLWSGVPPPAEPRRPAARSRVALLIDVSPSMATSDAAAAGDAGAAASARLAAVLRSLTLPGPAGSPLEQLCRGRPVAISAVGRTAELLGEASPATAAGLVAGLVPAPPAVGASRQGDAVARAITEATDELAAVVIASDGAIEDGLSWTRAAQVAIDHRVPIVAIPVGDASRGGADAPTESEDAVAFTAVRLPSVAWVGEPVTIDVRAERLMPGTAAIPISVADRAGRVLADGVLGPDAPAGSPLAGVAGLRGTLRWTPGETGAPTLLVRAGSGVAAVAVSCTVAEEPIRVLLVDAVPRFEHRFLEQTLARDPRFDVRTCLLSSTATPGMRATAAIPMSVAEWDRFDVVVLGDVVPGVDDLPAAAATSLRDAASSSGVGVAWTPGRRYRAAASIAAADAWLPATPLPGADGSDGGPRRLRITPAGMDAGWFPGVDDEGLVGDAPGEAGESRVFTTLGRVRLRPSARVLAVMEPVGRGAAATSKRSLNEGGHPPAVVLDRIGAATVLGHLCETWRWRERGGTEGYRRHWRRVLLRLAQPHLLARLVPATIEVRPLQPREWDEPRIEVAATRPGVDRAGWTLEHLGPGGKEGPPRRLDLPGSATVVRTGPLEAGWHTLRLRTRDATTVAREFLVAARGPEHAGQRPRLAGMESAAVISGGAVVPLDRVAALADTIAALDRPGDRPGPPGGGLLDGPVAAGWIANLLVIVLAASCGFEWWLRGRGGLA